ncbi:MAG: HAD-IA family hydrolase [Acidimicrobiales bacterium]
MIRAALFDFGGVILSSPFDAFARYEHEAGLPPGLIRDINATNPDDNAWAKLERSEVDLDGFASLFESEAAERGHQVDGRAVIALLGGSVRPEMVEALRRCGERLKTAMLTNNFVSGRTGDPTADPTGRTAQIAEIMGMFDVIVESSKVGVRKPDPRFYEIACEQLAIDPTEAVFLDDLGINLKPARALGMTTIKVVDPDDAIDELEHVVGFALRG